MFVTLLRSALELGSEIFNLLEKLFDARGAASEAFDFRLPQPQGEDAAYSKSDQLPGASLCRSSHR